MPEVTWSFPLDPVAVPQARSLVNTTLAAWDLIDRVDEILLAVSELVTNAVRHGTANGSGRCLVKLSADDGRLRLEVHDLNRRRPRVRRSAADAIGGRGLFLVTAIADGWGVEPRGECGKAVWTEFKIEQGAR